VSDRQPSPIPPASQGDAKLDEQKAAQRSVEWAGRLVTTTIVVTLLLYWFADRYTPYTSQARIESHVVGIAPTVAGAVTEVSIVNNQTVKAGQPLFRVDPAPYRIALSRARSDLGSARRQISAGAAAVDSARANLDAARANERKCQQDLTRLTLLRVDDPGTISVRRVEIASAQLDQAKAQVAAAQAGIRRAIDQMGGDDDERNTLLVTALTAVEKAELELANTIVRAPSDGVITDLRTDVGLYARAGSPVLTLVTIHDVWVNAEFTENNLGHIVVGTPVEIVFDVLPGRVFKGQVRSIGAGVGVGRTPSPGTLPSIQNDRDWLRQSQRFPVIIRFDARPDSVLESKLRVGGQASVIAYGGGSSLLRLLARAYIRVASWLSYAY
jgi:multidrug resistance efflux pump